MKKNVFTYALFALLLICVMVSCSNNAKLPEVIAKNPATLKVNYFRQYYAVGDKEDKLVGTLSYTAEGGSSINTIDIKNEEVKKEGFNTTETAEGKTLKLTYKGIDVVVTYNVVKMMEFNLTGGEFIVGDNTTLLFKKDNTVIKTKWKSWDNYYNCTGGEEDKEYTYTPDISSSGRTFIRIDDWNYYPDEKGGLSSYPSFDQYLEEGSKYVPDLDYFYVSTGPEDSRNVTNPAAKNKYLVMQFDLMGKAYIWFVSKEVLDVPTDLRTYAKDTNAIIVEASNMSFGVAGVSMNKVEGTKGGAGAPDNANKNLTIILNKDGYDSTDKAFGIVSYADTDLDPKYYGYSYTMKLSDIKIVAPTV